MVKYTMRCIHLYGEVYNEVRCIDLYCEVYNEVRCIHGVVWECIDVRQLLASCLPVALAWAAAQDK